MIAVPSQGNAQQTTAGIVPALREPAAVDALMDALPQRRRRWCGMHGCECSGCANAVVSRDEWMAWFIRRWKAICDRCPFAVRVVTRAGRAELACEECDVAWA